ncbi:serine/threonine-protein kinase [Singulisphaera acidiphila]|uniref:Serine/threonine protein kinase n=1 Tax=Singulisphaera acidiphila (strain ATCC BAA-1392 / DSM 18658 / VKM B-2454 / MOB10) TaxID=886293 RepID=L0D7M9_SINAD|nr:serine/threonine-protein kinase [Singulisphaera acidiphila]AGA24656.1 serine/threonine protein kinase [Singulisphaera acidiphila DSM 18658]
MAAAHDDPIGTTFANGRYEITVKLGEGGMGAVYRAEDKNLQSSVVIKLPHRSMVTDAEFSRRFRDEVRSLVRLSHPHIVKVTDVGEWEGLPFAVLQFLPGGSLEDRLAAWKGPAVLAALVSWLGPIGSALDYVHSQKMVHRDVKPGNILFDAQGHPFLSDFGVVKVLAAAADDRSSSRTAMTGTGMVLGTPHYMAPELIMGDPFDGRVDQYALAVTAYELLCGRRPFEHEVATRVLMMQAQDAPPSMACFSPWSPPQLESALFKGLAKAPSDRYPTCAAFAAAVVEASGLEQGERGRARVRCGSCGKTMTVSVEVLAKLSQSGRSAPCPKCQKPLNLAGGTATVLPPRFSGERPRGSDTAVLDVRGGTAKVQALTPPQAKPETPGGGTVVFGSIPVKAVTKSRPELGSDFEPVDPGEDKSSRSPLFWVTIGLVAACIPLVAYAVFLWKATSGRPGNSQARATAEVVAAGQDSPVTPLGQGVARARIARNDMSDALVQRRLGEPESAAPRLETGPIVKVSPSLETTAPRIDASADSRIKSEALVDLSRPREGPSLPDKVVSDIHASQGERTAMLKGEPDSRFPEKPATALAPAPDPDPIADDEKPSSRNVPLRQLLATPEPLAGKLITLEQVYCVSKVPWRLEDGSLQVALIESDLELTANSARVRLRNSNQLGLDRQLADQLISLGKMQEIADSMPTSPDWIMQPANLTVKVSDSSRGNNKSAARIVRLELFESFKNEVRGSAKKKLIVLFATQTVTAAGVSTGFGNNDEWQKVPKLGHAYNQFQRFFESIQRQNSQMKWAAFSNQLNSLIGEGTRQSIAAQAESQRRIQQMITPSIPTR